MFPCLVAATFRGTICGAIKICCVLQYCVYLPTVTLLHSSRGALKPYYQYWFPPGRDQVVGECLVQLRDPLILFSTRICVEVDFFFS
jgi:hypothetical protein